MIHVSSTSFVDLDGVSKVYAGGITALENIELRIFQNEFLCLLGPSGCGKTTLLRLLAGLEKISAGRIIFQTQQKKRYDTGFVFQTPTLLPWANVFENIYLPYRLRGVTRDAARAKINSMLQKLGLSAFADKMPRELSLGMAMRVSLARALITEPSLLLLDEPFAALDEITRQQLNDDLLNLWRGSGTTIVFVTHSVAESVYQASRIAVMRPRPGQIAALMEQPQIYRDKSYRMSKDYIENCALIAASLQKAGEETVPA